MGLEPAVFDAEGVRRDQGYAAAPECGVHGVEAGPAGPDGDRRRCHPDDALSQSPPTGAVDRVPMSRY